MGLRRYFQRSLIDQRIVFAAALIMATLFLLQAYMHHFVYADLKEMGHFNWLREAPVPYLNFLLWALLCPLISMVLQRWPLSARPIWRSVATHVLFGLLIGAAHELLTSSIYYFILYRTGDFKWNQEYLEYAMQALMPATLQRFMEYWTFLAVLIAVSVVKQVREKENQLLRVQNDLQESQLNALRQQLRPHFLFNTLNSVSALVGKDPDGARRMLVRLGHLLRVSLDSERESKVRLAQEVDHVSNYLGIEAVRFRDRLSVRYEVPEELGGALVPSMVLQPLAENAIKHGPDARSERVEISVKAFRNNGTLTLTVVDDGRGCTDVANAMDRGGIGLRNVRERLRTLYGDRATMKASSPEGGGFRVDLSLPFEPGPTRHETHTHPYR
ncbi:MAG TPA: histidine kinase [Flavobacteriales bacterium]